MYPLGKYPLAPSAFLGYPAHLGSRRSSRPSSRSSGECRGRGNPSRPIPPGSPVVPPQLASTRFHIHPFRFLSLSPPIGVHPLPRSSPSLPFLIFLHPRAPGFDYGHWWSISTDSSCSHCPDLFRCRPDAGILSRSFFVSFPPPRSINLPQGLCFGLRVAPLHSFNNLGASDPPESPSDMYFGRHAKPKPTYNPSPEVLPFPSDLHPRPSTVPPYIRNWIVCTQKNRPNRAVVTHLTTNVVTVRHHLQMSLHECYYPRQSLATPL